MVDSDRVIRVQQAVAWDSHPFMDERDIVDDYQALCAAAVAVVTQLADPRSTFGDLAEAIAELARVLREQGASIAGLPEQQER